MKNFIITILLVWLFVVYRKKSAADNQTNLATPTPAPGIMSGSGSGSFAAAAQAATVVMEPFSGPVPVIFAYGNPADPAAAQRLVLDIKPAAAAGFAPGQAVRVLNTSLYPLYYRILEISDSYNGIKGIILDTLYIGAQDGMYLTKDMDTVGFNATTKKKGAFL
ncbi:MAG: hypothetical protein WCR20_01280 [Verrucomicrobiota bacterium]